jgi:hypothetical protein
MKSGGEYLHSSSAFALRGIFIVSERKINRAHLYRTNEKDYCHISDFFSASFVVRAGSSAKASDASRIRQMLYDLQKNPGAKDELVEAIRKRGIAFELTDGLRGLTASKSRSDADLRRTLEEAARRKANPERAKLPTEKESAEVLNKSREATLAAVEEMPDFVVKQQIARSAAYAGTDNFRNLDRLVVAVSYRSGRTRRIPGFIAQRDFRN